MKKTDWNVARGHNLQTGYQKPCPVAANRQAGRMLEKETDVGRQVTAV